VLLRIVEETKDLAVVEQNPKLEGRNMTMVLSPK
jgi:translation initiation factor IF-3